MAFFNVFLTLGGVPVTAPVDTPTIRVRRLDTDALVETDSALSHVGDGNWKFELTTVATLEYAGRIDADPNGTGQVDQRYYGVSASGIQDNSIEALIPTVPADVVGFDIRETVGADFSTLARQINAIRLVLMGRNEPTLSGNPNDVTVFQDDNNPKMTMALTDLSGGVVLSPVGVPAKRARAI